MQFLKLFLLIVEICAIGAALVFGILWLQQPQGPYEPYTFILMLLGGTTVDLIRRLLPNGPTENRQSGPPPNAVSEANPAGIIAQVQEGAVDLDVRLDREIRVIYPVTFYTRPNLDVRLESGLGNKVQITEEDEAGFTVVKPGFWTSGGSHTLLHWRATGHVR